jgi:hypothetical protein
MDLAKQDRLTPTGRNTWLCQGTFFLQVKAISSQNGMGAQCFRIGGHFGYWSYVVLDIFFTFLFELFDINKR